MVTKQDNAGAEQAFDWDAFIASPEADRDAAVKAEAEKRAAWLAQDPGTPIADGLAYLEAVQAEQAIAAAAKALGLTPEELRAKLAPPVKKSNGKGRGSKMDADTAREYIEAGLEEDPDVGKYTLIRAYREEVGPVNMPVWDELWSELSGR